MKLKKLLFVIIVLTVCSYNSFAQSLKTDSIEFFGKRFPSPVDCQVIGSMIKCNNYVFVCHYEPIEDLPRHKKELLAQLVNPRQVTVSVLGNESTGYLTKIDTWHSLNVVANINGKCTLINLYVDKPIETPNDLPSYLRQFLSIKK